MQNTIRMSQEKQLLNLKVQGIVARDYEIPKLDQSKITQELKDWVDKFLDEDKEAMDMLAKL